jgi:anti-sigma regulatory factor (Ser/Thr protein kinase)
MSPHALPWTSSRAYPHRVSHAAEGRRETTDTWVRAALEVLVGVPGVLRAGLALTEGGGRRLLFAASDRDNHDRVDWCAVDGYEDVPLNFAVRTGRMVAGSMAELAGRYPEFVGRQTQEMRAVATVPLSADDRVLGGFALFFGTDQPFDDAQLTALRRLGERLGRDLRRQPSGDAFERSPSGDEALPDGARVATHVVEAEPHGVAPARQFVRRTLARWGIDGDYMDTAVLCVSELVTNAIIHGAAGCELRVVLQHGVLTATVRDRGRPALRAEWSASDPLAVHGRGLQIVEALSSRWGSELDSVGMTVWCQLEVS